MSNSPRKTFLTWFDKKCYRSLIGFEDVGELCIEDFLPRLSGTSFQSGYYPILKEAVIKNLTKQAIDMNKFNYLLVFLRDGEVSLNPSERNIFQEG